MIAPPMVNSDDDGDASISHGIAQDESLHEKLHPTKSVTIAPADVLCGRGKTSFNHGEFLASGFREGPGRPCSVPSVAGLVACSLQVPQSSDH